MHERKMQFLNEHIVLYQKLFGFQKKFQMKQLNLLKILKSHLTINNLFVLYLLTCKKTLILPITTYC